MFRLGLTMAFLLVGAPAGAWSAQGHMASGAVAYDALAAADPAAIGEIRRLMAVHPDRMRFDAALGNLAGPARDRMLFELMARWPDEVRRTPFDHPGWHHEVRVVTGWRLFAPLRFGEAEPAFRRNLAIVRDADADPADRAVALCWVFHLAGDMHQPLHAGDRMSGRFPSSDHAGTIAWVRTAPDRPPVNLHYFWDRAADRATDDATGADDIAQAAEASVSPSSVPRERGTPETQFHAWTVESEKLARDVVYQGAGLAAASTRAEAPILPESYITTARTLSERRLGAAGVRIARLVASSFPVQ